MSISNQKLPWLDPTVKFEICEQKRSRTNPLQKYRMYCLSTYYPKNRYPNAPHQIEVNRESIYNFKDGIGNSYHTAAIKFASAIVNSLGMSVLGRNDSVCCVIPASTAYKTQNRFGRFCDLFSSLLGITNGVNFIKVIKDGETSHYGNKKRGDISNLEFDTAQFDSKTIYLFDDLITSGKSFVAVADVLKKAGAIDIKGLFLGKTYDSYLLGEPEWHQI